MFVYVESYNLLDYCSILIHNCKWIYGQQFDYQLVDNYGTALVNTAMRHDNMVKKLDKQTILQLIQLTILIGILALLFLN